MSYRVVLGVPDTGTAAEVRALLDEAGGFRVTETAMTATELVVAAGRDDTDVVLVHDDLGPLPVIDLVRDLGTRFPLVGLVVVVRDGSAEMLRAAMESGARGIVTLPLSLEELHARLSTAAAWSRSVRARLSGDAGEPLDALGGTMVAVAGAKGGVGTTTLAVHLALQAAGGGRRVCLVDFDLQAGDVANLLDITHRRSVADLVDVADDLSARHLDEALFVHASGVRILLAPGEGERGEDVRLRHARQILGGIKSRFDVVVVDCGTVVTEPTSVAVEMAETVLVVVTPDVPALRAAKRLLRLWARLQVRKDDDVTVVVNRVSRNVEVQPDLARKVVEAPLARTVVPAGFRHLEAAANTGSPDRLEDGPVRRAVAELAEEIGIAVPGGARVVRGGRRRRRRGEAGQVAVESVPVLALILLVALLVWQGLLTGLTLVLAGNAATEGARKVAVGAPAAPAAVDRLPPAWRSGADVDVGSNWVRVDLAVPALVPGLVQTPFRVASRASTVREP